jgi:hypothetical protein
VRYLRLYDVRYRSYGTRDLCTAAVTLCHVYGRPRLQVQIYAINFTISSANDEWNYSGLIIVPGTAMIFQLRLTVIRPHITSLCHTSYHCATHHIIVPHIISLCHTSYHCVTITSLCHESYYCATSHHCATHHIIVPHII